MRVVAILEFSADGDPSEASQLEALKQLIEDQDSAAVTIKVESLEVVR